jgi:hypothetical protein
MGIIDQSSRLVAPSGLVIGAVLGMAGTFVPSASLRGLFWGLDGIALIVATALLTIHHVRRGNDAVAAGFLVFVVGETLILSGAAMDLAASGPLFAAGTGLWAASLVLVSVPRNISAELTGKRLELLREVVPRLSRVAYLWDPDIRGLVSLASVEQ